MDRCWFNIVEKKIHLHVFVKRSGSFNGLECKKFLTSSKNNFTNTWLVRSSRTVTDAYHDSKWAIVCYFGTIASCKFAVANIEHVSIIFNERIQLNKISVKVIL